MAYEFLFANNATTTLAESISATATVINVASGDGNLFPSPASGQAFAFTLVDAATSLKNEIVYCTGRNGDALTVIRGQEGTQAISWGAGDKAANFLTSGTIGNFLQSGALSGYALTDDTVAQDVNGNVIGVASLGWDTKNNEAVAKDTAGGSHTFLPTSQASITNGTETNIGNQQWQSFYINNISGSGTQVTFPLEFGALPTILLQPTSELNTNLAITANPVPGSLTTSGFKVNINNAPGTASANGCGLWVWAYGASK